MDKYYGSLYERCPRCGEEWYVDGYCEKCHYEDPWAQTEAYINEQNEKDD